MLSGIVFYVICSEQLNYLHIWHATLRKLPNQMPTFLCVYIHMFIEKDIYTYIYKEFF